MKMSLIVLVALAVSYLLRRRCAALRHWVLAVAVACAAAMPILSTTLPAWQLPFATPTVFSPYGNPWRDAGSPQPSAPSAGTSVPSRSVAVGTATSQRSFNLGATLQFIWLAGAAAGLAILLTGVLRLSWVAAHADRITQGRWHDLAE